MSRFNDGVVKTNENCIGCNRCVNVCPVMGANISIGNALKMRIEVSSKRCISCGKCITECSHHARVYTDDVSEFLGDLEKGKKIDLLLDPTFYFVFGDKAYEIIGYFKELGVENVIDSALGTEISMYCHAKYLKDNREENGLAPAFITHTCPAIVNYAKQCNPRLLPMIIPVQLPCICSAIYMRKYLGYTNPIAYLGPCVAMTGEFLSEESGGHIKYNITFRHLANQLKKIKTQDYYGESDVKGTNLGRLVISNGLFSDMVKRVFPSEDVFVNYDHLNMEFIDSITDGSQRAYDNHPFMCEISTSDMGCIFGPGVDESNYTYCDMLYDYKESVIDIYNMFDFPDTPDKCYQAITEKYERLKLNPEDFKRSFTDDYRQPYQVPARIYEDIFNRMHKTTYQKRNINCGSCGYASCVDMANAIANGYSKMSNCIHYMADELENQIFVDNITKMPTKLGFVRSATHMLQINDDVEFVLITANINKLRVVNELYDINVGDEIIRSLGRTIRDTVAGYGIVGHLGGGCFAILVERDTLSMSEITGVEEYNMNHLGVDFPISLRFGIYYIGKQEEYDVNKMLDYCLFAMSKITERSRNSYKIYDNLIRDELANDTEITRVMKKALDNEEFKLFFQPQFSHGKKKVVGAEVLIRWVKSDGRMVSPGVFIPIFERNGFIKVMDQYVWKNAFKIMKTWVDTGINVVPISVNISRVSLADDDILEVISGLQKEYGLDNDLIHFEITESAYSDNQDEIIERVTKIREMGYRIAMDDFGTGYSSLNVLKDVPIDILKLDMGFLRKKTNSDKGMSILNHMVGMALDMNLDTIAEGVEELEQADFFGKIGCDTIQGFLYAKPMPQNEFEVLLSRQ